jgi:hypothetical protein
MSALRRRSSVEKLRLAKAVGVVLPFSQCWRKGMSRQRGALRQRLSREQRWEVIRAYFQKLDMTKGPVAEESGLPYTKGLIRLAIFQEILENPNCEMRNQLEISYVQLESFISREEHGIIAGFMAESRRLEEMADTGDPTSIMNSVHMIKKGMGDLAVGIQEKISERMKRRLAQIREIGRSRLAAVGPICDWCDRY